MKIAITGKGGQGIKLLGKILADLLLKKGYEIALVFDFDAAVRGGDSAAYLVYSEDKIENPIIDEADILIELAETSKQIKSKKKIGNIEGKPANMHALARVLKELGLEFREEEIAEALPERNREENLKVIMENL